MICVTSACRTPEDACGTPGAPARRPLGSSPPRSLSPRSLSPAVPPEDPAPPRRRRKPHPHSTRRAGGTGQGGGPGATATLAPAGRQLAVTADLTVRARNVTTAVTSATRIVTSAGGYVPDESTTASPAHPSQSSAWLQLKIPAAVYPATLSRLAGSLGTQVSLKQRAQDVTGQVADTNSRVASSQAAIAQLRALLSRAGSVSGLLSVQNQIDTEESDMEELQARQRALDHETAYATVSLSLLGPPAAPKHARGARPAWPRG